MPTLTILTLLLSLLAGNAALQAPECDPTIDYAQEAYIERIVGIGRYEQTGQADFDPILELIDCAEEQAQTAEEIVDVHIGRGEVARYLGQYDVAMSEYELAMEAAPDEASRARLYAAKGGVLYETGDYEEAVRFYEQGVAAFQPGPNGRASDAFPYYLDLGLAYQMAGRVEEAEEAFAKVLELQPDISTHIVARRARAYFDLANDSESALELLNGGLAESPDNVELRWLRGRVYAAEGRYDDAIADLNIAVDGNEANCCIHNPNVLYYWRGWVHLHLENYEMAAADFQVAIDILPLPIYYSKLGDTYLALERHEEAIEAYQYALSLGDDPFIYAQIGMVYYFDDQPAQALAFLRTYIALHEEPDASDPVVESIIAELEAAQVTE